MKDNLKPYVTANLIVTLILVVSLIFGVIQYSQMSQQLTALSYKVSQIPIVTPEPTSRDLQNGVPFRFVHTNRQHPVVRLMMLGFFEACEKYQVDCVDMGSDGNDDALYIQSVQESMSLGSSGIIGVPYAPYIQVHEQAIQAGIPTISIHLPLKQSDLPGLLAWVATDIADYGKRAADAMAEQINCTGPVAVTQGSFNDTENLAASSFKDELIAKCPGITVLDPQEEGFDVPTAIAKAAAILTANPDITGAYGTTGGSATTWSKALEQAGKQPGDVKVIAMDYSRVNLDFVKAGWVYALVAQPIYEETYRAVELLVANLHGEPVAFDNPYPAPLVTIADLDKYYGYADRVDAMLNQ